MKHSLDFRGLRAEVRALLRLAGPIAAVQVGMMMMGVVETVIVGRVSPAALAGVALGHMYFFATSAFGMGVLFALDPLISQAIGAEDHDQVTLSLQRAVLLALGLSVITAVLFLPVGAVLRFFGQPAEVVPLAATFVRISIPGVLAFYLFVAFRQTLQAMRKMCPIVITIVAANLLNAAVCAVLALGLFGAPRLGVAGGAWAGTVSRWFMLFMLAGLAWKDLAGHLKPVRRETFDLRALVRILALGVPIGTQITLEFGVFTVVGLMMGHFGTVPVASHQVAINIASLTFMVPLGVSTAAAVQVGHAIGRADVPAARRAAAAALTIGVGYMVGTALLFFTAPRALASIYSPDAAVQALSTALIPIAGVFQVFDGIQIVSIGALRGLGDTRAPVWINVLGFWLIGFPVSLALAFSWGFGPAGLWWGLVAGLAAVAVLLVVRLRRKLSGWVDRVRIEEPPPGGLAPTRRSSV